MSLNPVVNARVHSADAEELSPAAFAVTESVVAHSYVLAEDFNVVKACVPKCALVDIASVSGKVNPERRSRTVIKCVRINMKVFATLGKLN